MGGSTKTYNNIQVNAVLDDYKDAYETVTLDAYKSILGGTSSDVINALGTTMADNRSVYNEGFLSALGYNPSETVKYYTLNESVILDWAKANIDNDIADVSNVVLQVPTNDMVAIKYFQDNYTYNYNNRIVTYSDGKDYYFVGATALSISQISVTLRLNKFDTIDEYVENNYNDEYSVITYGPLVEDPNSTNYWEAELEHMYDQVETNEQGEETTTTVIEIIDIQVPVVYADDGLDIPSAITDVNEYVLNNYNGYSENHYELERVSDDTGSSYHYEWKAVFTAHVSATNAGFVVTATYSLTYGSVNNYLLNQLDAFRLEVISSINDYVSDNAEFVTFTYNDEVNGTQVEYVKKSEIPNVVTTANASAYPILPLKRRQSFVNTDHNRKVMLNKIGMVGNEFNQSLADKDVYSAYLFFGVNIKDTTVSATKLLFETLDFLALGGHIGVEKDSNYYNKKLTVAYSGLKIETGVDTTGVTIAGSIGPTGTYRAYTRTYEVEVTDIDSEGHTYTKTVTRTEWVKEKQISEFFFRRISIRNAKTVYAVDGKVDGLQDDDKKVYIPLLREATNRLNFKDLMYIFGKSLQLMVLTRVKVKTKWYQSGFFKFIMLVVIVVIAYFTGGVGAALFSLLVSVGVQAGLIKGTLATILNVIMIIYGGYQAFTGTMSTGLLTLAIANTLVQTATLANQISIAGFDGKGGKIGELQEKYENTQGTLEEANRLQKELEDSKSNVIMPPGITHRYADTFYALAYGELGYNYDILYNYDMLYKNDFNTSNLF